MDQASVEEDRRPLEHLEVVGEGTSRSQMCKKTCWTKSVSRPTRYFAIALLLLFATFLIASQLHGGHKDPVKPSGSHDDTPSTHNLYLEGRTSYQLSRVDDSRNPFETVPLWLVIPSETPTWAYDINTQQVDNQAANTITQLRECGGALRTILGANAEQLHAARESIALRRCKTAIERRLLELTENENSAWQYAQSMSILQKRRQASSESHGHSHRRWGKRNCTHEFCVGFLSSDSVCRAEQGRHRKAIPENCDLCNPRNETLIAQRCQSMVMAERNTLYVVLGIFVLFALPAIIAVVLKNKWVQGHCAQRPAGGPVPQVGQHFTDGALDGRLRMSRAVHTRMLQQNQERAANAQVQRNLDVLGGGKGYGNPLNGQINNPHSSMAAATDLVRVMPPAPTARCRSSSSEIQSDHANGLLLRRISQVTQRRQSKTDLDDGRGLEEALPVTSEVLKYGLGGRLCTSEDAGTTPHADV